MKERHKRAAAVMASLASNPDGDIDVKDMSLSNAGAAGAFVHGLEDEFSGLFCLWSWGAASTAPVHMQQGA